MVPRLEPGSADYAAQSGRRPIGKYRHTASEPQRVSVLSSKLAGWFHSVPYSPQLARDLPWNGCGPFRDKDPPLDQSAVTGRSKKDREEDIDILCGLI
jgi:hypothetical protein